MFSWIFWMFIVYPCSVPYRFWCGSVKISNDISAVLDRLVNGSINTIISIRTQHHCILSLLSIFIIAEISLRAEANVCAGATRVTNLYQTITVCSVSIYLAMVFSERQTSQQIRHYTIGNLPISVRSCWHNATELNATRNASTSSRSSYAPRQTCCKGNWEEKYKTVRNVMWRIGKNGADKLIKFPFSICSGSVYTWKLYLQFAKEINSGLCVCVWEWDQASECMCVCVSPEHFQLANPIWSTISPVRVFTWTASCRIAASFCDAEHFS